MAFNFAFAPNMLSNSHMYWWHHTMFTALHHGIEWGSFCFNHSTTELAGGDWLVRVYRAVGTANDISKDVILASGKWLLILGFALPDVYYKHWMLSVFTRCLWKKNASCYLGGTRTHDLLLSSADVLTTRPPNLPVATGWFEYIEQWVLQTIFPKMLFLRQGDCY